MDRCSIVNCGSMMVLGIGAGPFTPILPPARRGEPLDRDAIVTAAARAEGHPDNVAAAVLGGLAVSCADGARVTAVSLPVPREIAWVVLVPETESSTREARAVLPDSVPRADAVFNVQRVSLLLAGLGADRPDLLDLAMQDRLHQPYRRRLFPWMEAVAAAGRRAGALGCVPSGAGPSMLAAGRGPRGALGRAAVTRVPVAGAAGSGRSLSA